MTHRPWKDTLTGDTFVQSMLQQSHRDYTDIDIFIRSRIYPREASQRASRLIPKVFASNAVWS